MVEDAVGEIESKLLGIAEGPVESPALPISNASTLRNVFNSPVLIPNTTESASPKNRAGFCIKVNLICQGSSWQHKTTTFCTELTSHSPPPPPLLPALIPSAGEHEVSGG